jgi:hypothetical protein
MYHILLEEIVSNLILYNRVFCCFIKNYHDANKKSFDVLHGFSGAFVDAVIKLVALSFLLLRMFS